MENLNKRPSKGILRFSENSRSNSVEKDIRWDEANIKETLHPDDKDYGFMRIDEPPTPFSRSPHGHSGENSDEENLQAETNDLLERVSRKIKEPPISIENVEDLLDENDLEYITKPDTDDQMVTGSNMDAECASTSQSLNLTLMSDDLTSSRASGSSASEFELKRKRHYNEFYAVKLAKKLMQKGIDDDDEEDDDEAEDEDENEDVENETGTNAGDEAERTNVNNISSKESENARNEYMS